MKTREERNAEFMNGIDNLSTCKLRVACYHVARYLPELDDSNVIVAALKDKYNEDKNSWLIDSIGNEYNRVKNMNEHNLQIWANYRLNNNCGEPIVDSQGNFLDVRCLSICVTINGKDYCIGDSDGALISVKDSNTDVYLPFSVMRKLIQIDEHWKEIKRLVE